jgi:hypothetical protein
MLQKRFEDSRVQVVAQAKSESSPLHRRGVVKASYPLTHVANVYGAIALTLPPGVY